MKLVINSTTYGSSIFADTPEGMQKLLNVVQELVWNANQCEDNVFVGNR